MISSLDLAKYIITYCNYAKKSISNLRLQTLLFLVWHDFYQQTEQVIFNESFELCKFGIYIPSVYYDYVQWGGLSISEIYSEHPDFLIKNTQLLGAILEKYGELTTHKLLECLELNPCYQKAKLGQQLILSPLWLQFTIRETQNKDKILNII